MSSPKEYLLSQILISFYRYLFLRMALSSCEHMKAGINLFLTLEKRLFFQIHTLIHIQTHARTHARTHTHTFYCSFSRADIFVATLIQTIERKST